MSGRTFWLPHDEGCPKLVDMPTVNLVRGVCPRCGSLIEGKAAARLLVARRLVEERRRATYERRIREAADDVAREPRLWDTIEALAGMFWPKVKADIDAELRRRA